jgi:uridine kinase
MKFSELVEEIRDKAATYPYVMALDGTIGSGKSYEAEKLHEALGDDSLLMSMDLFVRVKRSDWDERLEKGHIHLRQWYDIEKVRETLGQIKEKKKFRVSGLYNLANGEMDHELEIDASGCKYFILEGLFSCDYKLSELIDLVVFINVPTEVALDRAESRDHAARNLSHRGWVEKKKIFFDGYLPYLEEHKEKADFMLDPD